MLFIRPRKYIVCVCVCVYMCVFVYIYICTSIYMIVCVWSTILGMEDREIGSENIRVISSGLKHPAI
jgi:hypothetical protein